MVALPLPREYGFFGDWLACTLGHVLECIRQCIFISFYFFFLILSEQNHEVLASLEPWVLWLSLLRALHNTFKQEKKTEGKRRRNFKGKSHWKSIEHEGITGLGPWASSQSTGVLDCNMHSLGQKRFLGHVSFLMLFLAEQADLKGNSAN